MQPDQCKSYRDVMFMVAKRAAELANMTMVELRLCNGYGCNTENECHQKDKGKSRGEIIEEILMEELDIDCDKDFE